MEICVYTSIFTIEEFKMFKDEIVFFSFRLYFYGEDNIEKILRLNVYIKTFIQDEDAHCRSIFFVTKMNFMEISRKYHWTIVSI